MLRCIARHRLLVTVDLLVIACLWVGLWVPPAIGQEREGSAVSDSERIEEGAPQVPEVAGSPRATATEEAGDQDGDGGQGFLPRYAYRRQGRSLQSGLRVEHTRGELRVSRETFQQGGQARGIELPPHLGGGFLFFQSLAVSGSSATALYRAETWTGRLQPLVSVPFSVQQVQAGFDRVYVFGTAVQIALDARTGQLLPLDPLPPLVTVENLAFSSSQALVEAPLAGVQWTPDAGLTWRRLPDAVGVEPSEVRGRLIVQTSDGARGVAPDGSLRLLEATALDRESSTGVRSGLSSDAVRQQEADLGRIVTAGLPIEPASQDDQTARWLALGEGHRIEARLESEAAPSFQLVRAPDDRVPAGPCLGTDSPVERALFLCHENPAASRAAKPGGREPLRLVEWSEGKLRTRARLRGHKLLARGRGAFLVEGDCNRGRRGSVCWVKREGARAVELGGLARSRQAGRLALAVSAEVLHAVQWRPEEEELLRYAVSFPEAGKTASLARPEERIHYPLAEISGVRDWVSGATVILAGGRRPGKTNLWLTAKERFVGATLGDDGAVNFGPLQRPVSRAVFDGSRALVWGAAGFAKQSVDGGLLFTELRLPFRSGDAELAAPLSSATEVEMGCGVLGCVMGPWVRWGWSAGEFPEAPLPAPRPLPPQGGGRARFSCGRGDVVSSPRAPSGKRDFPSFWETPPPALSPREDGFSIGFSHDVARLYAMGPDAPAWPNSGRLQLRFVDPYDPARILETRPTIHVLDDRIVAETLLGVLDRTTSRSEISLDVGGEAGLIFLRTRGEQGLFRFEAAGALARIPLETADSGASVGISSLAGTAVAGGRWFFGYTEGRSYFVVAEARDAGISVIARLPWGEASARGAQLVRTDDGHLGVAMEGDRGLLLYPLDQAGELGQPLVVPHRVTRPAACHEHAAGYLVDREYSLAPYLETPSGRALSTSSPRALLRVGDGPPCLEGLTARSRGTIEVNEELPRTNADRVPLTLLSSDSAGKRVSLICH